MEAMAGDEGRGAGGGGSSGGGGDVSLDEAAFAAELHRVLGMADSGPRGELGT